MSVQNTEPDNEFRFNNARLISVRDYGNIVKGIVQSRQTYLTPDGQLKSRFVASRQVTFLDEEVVNQLRPMLADSDEFIVNISGYMTTTRREKDGKTNWYDNQIVTQLEVLS